MLLLVGSKLGREDTSIWGIVIPYSGGLFDWLEIDVEAVMFICFQCIYFRVNVLLDA